MKGRFASDARCIRKGREDAARWNRPLILALLVNFVALFEFLVRRTPVGIRDHSPELYGEILFRIALARGGWK